MATKTDWAAKVNRIVHLAYIEEVHRGAWMLLSEFAEEAAAVIKAHDSTKCECFDCLQTVANEILSMLPPKKKG